MTATTTDAKTIRDAILESQTAVDTAVQRRNCLLTDARNNGVPLRTLASLVGVTASTVMRWTDNGEKQRQSDHYLDFPASSAGELPGSER